MSNIAEIKNDIYALRETFQSRLANSAMNFEAEAGFAVQQIESNDYLLSVALNNRQSVINAVTNVGAIGISLNPARKQAHLVPRDRKVCLDISYIGLVDLATQSGSVVWVKPELVYSSDLFEMGEPGKAPRHKFNPFAKDRGEVIGAYVVAKTHAGEHLCEAMSVDEISAIRDRSSAWKSYKNKGVSCPWVTDPGEMQKKTVIKRASKMWPKNDRLNMAIQHLNADLAEGIEFAAHPRRQSGAEVAATANQVPVETEETEERKNLIADLELVAKKQGTEAYATAFKAVGKDGRKMVGATEHERLWALASAFVSSKDVPQ